VERLGNIKEIIFPSPPECKQVKMLLNKSFEMDTQLIQRKREHKKKKYPLSSDLLWKKE